MRVIEKSQADVIEVVFAAMKTRGWSKDQATVIGNRYYDCSSLLTSKIAAFGRNILHSNKLAIAVVWLDGASSVSRTLP
ncbi:hypothetical protein GQ600_26621 [Phytophthora cactorum]|nr:hypothetical protein GQ600_26621 [Phytophthora cactorum]